MENFSQHIQDLLSQSLFWGVIALVSFGLALSGRFSVTAASWILWAAWAMATFGLYRAAVYFELDILLRLLVTGGLTIGIAIGVVLVNRWINSPKAQPSIPESKPPVAHEHYNLPAHDSAIVAKNPPVKINKKRSSRSKPKSISAQTRYDTATNEELGHEITRLAESLTAFAKISGVRLNDTSDALNRARSKTPSVGDPPVQVLQEAYFTQTKDFTSEIRTTYAAQIVSFRSEARRRLTNHLELDQQEQNEWDSISLILESPPQVVVPSQMENYARQLKLMGQNVSSLGAKPH